MTASAHNPIVYITYNPKSRLEEATALRLQTIASLYGLRVELPDRIGVGAEANTEQRLDRSSFVIAFSLRALSEKVKSEIKHAIATEKTTIVIYDKKAGKTAHFANKPNVFETVLDIDSGDTGDTLHRIIEFIRQRQGGKKTASKPETKSNADTELMVMGLLGVGLFMLLMGVISDQRR